ncbi:MAG: hypothetical protein WDN06_05945 [Asticcacaulis sp.]
MFLLKCAGLWLVLVIGQIAGGMVTSLVAPASAAAVGHDGPLSAAAALPVIAAIFALMLGGLAAHMRWNGWRKALVLFTVLYGVGSVMSQIEAVYFNSYLKLSMLTTAGALAGDAIRAALAAAACAFLWRGGSDEPAERFGGLGWKLPVIVPIYIVFYFGAGALIAWQGAAVRHYYGQGMHIDPGQLALLQVFRGALWAGLALMMAKALTGGRWLRAALTGGAFAVFMAVLLLYPISFMPWDVRKFHIMEIGSSNFLFGLLAVLIITIGFKPAKAPH